MFTQDNKLRILTLFFEGPNERLHLREIARRTGLSATGAMKILGALEKESIVKKERAACKWYRALWIPGSGVAETFEVLHRIRSCQAGF